jgi:hypothetical protein
MRVSFIVHKLYFEGILSKRLHNGSCLTSS